MEVPMQCVHSPKKRSRELRTQPSSDVRVGGSSHSERLAQVVSTDGIEQLTDEELVSTLFTDDANTASAHSRVREIWDQSGGIAGLVSYGLRGLVDLGVRHDEATRLLAAFELGNRALRIHQLVENESATSANDVNRWARGRLVHLFHEELWGLILDERNRVVAHRLLARGGVHACALTVRDVLRPMVREGAAAFVLVHNHPGGDPCPSSEDLAFTRRITPAAKTLGMVLVDHVVVAREGFVSMLEAGLFDCVGS